MNLLLETLHASLIFSTVAGPSKNLNNQIKLNFIEAEMITESYNLFYGIISLDWNLKGNLLIIEFIKEQKITLCEKF